MGTVTVSQPHSLNGVYSLIQLHVERLWYQSTFINCT